MTPPRIPDPHEEPEDPITKRGDPLPGMMDDGTLNVVEEDDLPEELGSVGPEEKDEEHQNEDPVDE